MVATVERAKRRPRQKKAEDVEYFTAKEVAQKLRIGMTNVYKLMNTGKLGFIEMTDDGHCRRVTPAQLEAYIKARTKNARGRTVG